MKPEEKIEICSVCKKRDFCKEKGVLCSLNGEKPNFERQCAEFEPDQMQIELKEDFRRKEIGGEMNTELQGAPAIFAYVGILVGSAIVASLAIFSPQSLQEVAVVVASATIGVLLNPLSLFILWLGWLSHKKGDIVAYMCFWLFIMFNIISSIIMLGIYAFNGGLTTYELYGSVYNLLLSCVFPFVILAEIYNYGFLHHIKSELKAKWKKSRCVYVAITLLLCICALSINLIYLF